MKSILLIDDSMIQLRILQGLLQNKYETIMATSGMEGLAIAKRELPDLILLDYDMPIMSGKETFRQLQEQDETKNIPVVFLTGVDGRKKVEEVLIHRPQGYLLKPVQQSRLLETVERVLAQ
ncbi:MAG: response regulator [Lachnospiraceae bacterium]|nr:response regulator [Lachnospiraceae bacterium]